MFESRNAPFPTARLCGFGLVVRVRFARRAINARVEQTPVIPRDSHESRESKGQPDERLTARAFSESARSDHTASTAYRLDGYSGQWPFETVAIRDSQRTATLPSRPPTHIDAGEHELDYGQRL